jgi:hypothetical protein
MLVHFLGRVALAHAACDIYLSCPRSWESFMSPAPRSPQSNSGARSQYFNNSSELSYGLFSTTADVEAARAQHGLHATRQSEESVAGS